MKKIVVIAALLAMAAAQPAWAATKGKPACMPAGAAEAAQALRYMTELGIAGNACTSIGIYADFRTRNRDAIVAYQKAMIAHLHGAKEFDKWNTVLANQLAQQHASMVPAQFCQQAMPLLEQAKTLDTPKYRAYAAAQAAADTKTVKCAK
ncbi:MAG TPA: hypothetical protein VGQ90_14060 [Stellaceae bacterium]|jgi:hypothetical protein|nr:hypothetical protein [Stellaceae bacterium]